jgi:hypothetical protein
MRRSYLYAYLPGFAISKMLCDGSHPGFKLGFGFIVFNATFNNISVISWWSAL